MKGNPVQVDVIVAGAGPAGSTAARELASRGMSVALLDRASFPRDKPCGGGVSRHTAALLPFSIEPVTERVIRGMFVSVNQRRSFTRYSELPLGHLTQRSRLDTLLVEHARRAGAVLRERAPVRAVIREGPAITVEAGSERFHARYLVAADGANGPTPRLAGLTVSRWLAVALEGNVTPRRGFPTRWSDTIGIELGAIPGGYGWIFPKGDHLNVGVGGTHGIGPSLRSRLAEMTRFYRFDTSELWGVRGHPLPVRQPHAPIRDRNVLLVGDAAGLVDPLSGEGIFYAVRSGQLAAQSIHAHASGDPLGLEVYDREMRDGVLPNLHDALRIHDIFHMAPGVFAELARRSPWAWNIVSGIVSGEITYTHLKHRSPALSMGIDLLSDLARAARAWRDPSDHSPRPERFLAAWLGPLRHQPSPAE